MQRTAARWTSSWIFSTPRPSTCPIRVQCGQGLGRNPWPGLTITSTAVSGSQGNVLYTGGHVVGPFNRASTTPNLLAQLVSFPVLFTYPPTASNASYQMSLHIGGGPAVVGEIVSWVSSSGAAVPTNVTLPRAGTLTLTVTTLCSQANSLFTAFLLIQGRQRGPAPIVFDDITVYLSWTCTLPLFDLYTGDAGLAIPPDTTTAPNLLSGGGPVDASLRPYEYSTRNGQAKIFTIDLDLPAVFEDVALYLRTTAGAPAILVPFNWTMSPSSSLNYHNMKYTMRYNGQPVTGNPPSVAFSLPTVNGTWSPALEMLGAECLAPGDHVLTTYLSYGWGVGDGSAVQLDFRRRCDEADVGPTRGESGMSAGGVVAVVFFVGLMAFCVMGCGWRWGREGKRGWEVVPGHEWWVGFQDRVLGPKRYSAQMEEDGEEVEIPVTSSTYGTYQGDL